MSELRIQLLGGFQVSIGARIIHETEWRLRKTKSLVKLLALAPGHSLHREQIIEVLWPDQNPDAAANNLYYETLTAANGDTLQFVSHDIACPTGVNRFHGTGHWEVTGGTGRFSGATGTGTADGHADFNVGVYSFQVTGTISIPNGP